MPNRQNADAPVILLGPGRSGSSLIMNVFAHHGECVTVGETANVIFGVWQGLIDSEGGIPPLIENERLVPGDDRAGRAVREVFLTCFPDERRFWMQKPIGVPQALLRFADPGSEEAGTWFWRAMRASFPRARYLVALRHPCDVVLSSRDKWGFDDASIWRTQANLAGLILHADAPPAHAVHDEALVSHSESSVREMLDAAGLPFDPAVLQAFQTIHVPVRGRERPSETGFSRRHEWDALDPATLSSEYRASIASLYERFGAGVEWPARFRDAARRDATPTEASLVEQFEARIGDLNRRMELMHLDHADALRRAEEAHQLQWASHMKAARLEWEEHQRIATEEFRQYDERTTRIYNEQKAWIEELERGKAWLESQVNSWRAIAEAKRGSGGPAS